MKLINKILHEMNLYSFGIKKGIINRVIMEGDRKISLFVLFYDRLVFIYKILFIVFKVKITKRNILNCYLEEVNNIENRQLHLMSYKIGTNLSYINYKDGVFIDIEMIFRFIIKYFKNLKYLKYVFIDFSKVKYSVIADYLNNKLYLELINIDSIFIYNYISLSNYLIALYFGKNTNINIYYIYSSSPLYFIGRYDSFERVNIVFCSKVQLDEYNTYIEKGWRKSEKCSIHIWGPDSNLLNNDKPIDKELSIGFFSSGEWARSQGVWRVKEEEALYHANNDIAILASDILKALKRFCELNEIKFIIYLHPYEKYLINVKGIYPPFYDSYKNDIANFELDNNNTFMVKIGVSILSSVFYDRHHFELLTYNMNNSLNKNKYLISKKYLNAFSNYTYSNADELLEKLQKTIDA